MPEKTRIAVDAKRTIADTSRRQIGINLNYLRDDDRNLPHARPLVEALAEMGARYIRYPGGEKSDYHLWSLPPYDAPNPQVFDRGTESPESYVRYAAGHHVMDFDAFMAICRRVGAEPYVVVGATPFEGFCGEITLERYLENATTWVRYANLKKHYGVRYWEIGNENWQSLTAEECADLGLRFSRAMKAVDPTIKTGVSGNSRAYFETILEKAGEEIDFLVASCYPCFQWNSYDHYAATPEVSLVPAHAIQALENWDGGRYREKMKVVAAEVNSWDWAKDGWPTTSNLGHTLVTFEIFGQLLSHPLVDFGMLWTTRWMDYQANGIANGLGPANELKLPGLALKIWSTYLFDNLVAVDRTETLVTFAAHDPGTGGLNLFLLNKGYTAQDVAVSVSAARQYAAGAVHRLQGEGPDDQNPVWSDPGAVTVAKNELELALPAVSLTVVEMG